MAHIVGGEGVEPTGKPIGEGMNLNENNNSLSQAKWVELENTLDHEPRDRYSILVFKWRVEYGVKSKTDDAK